MIFSTNTRNILFKVFELVACLAAAYHFVGVFYKINESPVWRQWLFVGVNMLLAYGFLHRPKYFIYFFTLLLIQQYYSHSTYMIGQWVQYRAIDWISLFILIIFPIVLICLVQDRRT